MLNPENLELMFLFEGDRRLELCMQSIFPPAHGEFWKDEDLDDMVSMLKLIVDERPVPSRPCFPYTEHVEKLACCTSILHGIWISTYSSHARERVHRKRKLECYVVMGTQRFLPRLHDPLKTVCLYSREESI